MCAGVGDEGMHRSLIAYIFGMSIHLTDSGLEKVDLLFLTITDASCVVRLTFPTFL